MQCQTDAIRFCTCELCGALGTPRNSPDLSLGEQLFTVIAQVNALVVGKKKKKSQGTIMWRGKNPPCYGHRVTCSILFPKRMETDFPELIVSKGVSSLHPYMWVELQLLMVSDALQSLAWNRFS